MLPHKIKDFELRLGKLGLIIFILGMSVALLVVFVFGVKVGKDVDSYPGKIVGIIPGLKGKVLSRPAETEGKSAGAEAKDAFKLGFYDALKKGEGTDELQDVKNRPSPGSAAPAEQRQAGAVPSPPAPAQKAQAEPAAPAVAAQQPPARAEAVKTPALQNAEPSSRYFIQVAALKDEAKARALKAKLEKLGYEPKFETIKKDKGKLFRIRLMGYSSQEEASKVLGKLEKQLTGTKCLIHKETK